ncbi:MAG: DUF4258 domain-containing protein [Nanoarchaeota archaeon]
MPLIFTDHAKQRMIERGIKPQEVQDTIDMPDYTISKEGKKESIKKIGNKNLKIIYSEKGKFIKVITVIDKI